MPVVMAREDGLAPGLGPDLTFAAEIFPTHIRFQGSLELGRTVLSNIVEVRSHGTGTYGLAMMGCLAYFPTCQHHFERLSRCASAWANSPFVDRLTCFLPDKRTLALKDQCRSASGSPSPGCHELQRTRPKSSGDHQTLGFRHCRVRVGGHGHNVNKDPRSENSLKQSWLRCQAGAKAENQGLGVERGKRHSVARIEDTAHSSNIASSSPSPSSESHIWVRRS